MVNKVAASWGTAFAMCMFLLYVSAELFGPRLILRYWPPVTGFDPGIYSFDSDGAVLITPTFNKHWCVFQPGGASAYATTDGISERINLVFIDDAAGDPNRPPGKHRGGLWKIDIYAQPDATEYFVQVTHKCLGFITVVTKSGPFDIPKQEGWL